MPAHFAGLPRSVSVAFIVIAVTRGFTDATATRASFTLATLRDLIFPGTAASFSFQVRSSEVVWISMISLRGLHLFVLPARCHVHMQGSPGQRRGVSCGLSSPRCSRCIQNRRGTVAGWRLVR